MTPQERIDAIFANPEAVKRLQCIYKQKEGELMDEYKLDDVETEMKRLNLIGFMNDYCGFVRCFISTLALAEMQKRGHA